MATAEAALEREQQPARTSSRADLGAVFAHQNSITAKAAHGLLYPRKTAQALNDRMEALDRQRRSLEDAAYGGPAMRAIKEQQERMRRMIPEIDRMEVLEQQRRRFEDAAYGGPAMRALEDEQERIRRLMPDIDRLSGLPRW